MNADHEEAMEFAKISKRENRVYVGNLSYEVRYRDLMEFMRGGGWGIISFLLVFGSWFGRSGEAERRRRCGHANASHLAHSYLVVSRRGAGGEVFVSHGPGWWTSGYGTEAVYEKLWMRGCGCAFFHVSGNWPSRREDIDWRFSFGTG
jgi:hypothetical protein